MEAFDTSSLTVPFSREPRVRLMHEHVSEHASGWAAATANAPETVMPNAAPI